jgi:hypothetical protein
MGFLQRIFRILTGGDEPQKCPNCKSGPEYIRPTKRKPGTKNTYECSWCGTRMEVM